jgi:hypothetical protein
MTGLHSRISRLHPTSLSPSTCPNFPDGTMPRVHRAGLEPAHSLRICCLYSARYLTPRFGVGDSNSLNACSGPATMDISTFRPHPIRFTEYFGLRIRDLGRSALFLYRGRSPVNLTFALGVTVARRFTAPGPGYYRCGVATPR